MSVKIGILAEDDTDTRAIQVLIRRIADEKGASVGVKRRSTRGCGSFRRKAGPFMQELASKQCAAAVLVHDRDDREEEALRRSLEALAAPDGLNRLICIPVEEIEAWFWSDQGTLDRIAREKGKAKACCSPHNVSNPKEKLIKLSCATGGKPRYTTNQNALLCEELDLDVCASRCAAFNDLRLFVRNLV